MFWFDFHWQIQNFLLQFWTEINFGLLIIAISLGYLAYKHTAYALGLTIILLPTYLFRSYIAYIPFTFLEIAIWITFIGWIISVLKKKQLLNLQRHYYGWPILLIILASAIGVFISPNLTAAAGLLKAYFIEPILFFLVLINVTKDEKNKQVILWSLGISTLIISLLAIYQKFTGFAIAEPAWTGAVNRRVTSIFTSPNAVGLFLGPIVALYLGWLIAGIKNLKTSLLKLLIIIPAVLAILFTVSQGTWLGLLAAIAFLTFFGWNKKWTTIIIAAAIIILVAVPITREKLTPLVLFQDASGQNRIALWQTSYNYLTTSPANFIFGAGIFGFPDIHQANRDPLKIESLLYPHNIFLNFWLEIGIVGLAAIIWLIIKFFKRGFSLTNDKWLTLGIMAAMITVVVHGLIDVPYFKNDLSILFWIIIGLL